MSKAVRIAINGFGRIGRSFLRALYENNYRDSIQVTLINEPAASEAIAHLLKYDSSHGRFGFKVTQSDDKLNVAGDDIVLTHETDITVSTGHLITLTLLLTARGFTEVRKTGNVT